MKPKRIPVTVTTYEALQICVKNRVSFIYIDGILYRSRLEKIHREMTAFGYTLADIPARRGVFYTKDIPPDSFEIHDPCNLY